MCSYCGSGLHRCEDCTYRRWMIEELGPKGWAELYKGYHTPERALSVSDSLNNLHKTRVVSYMQPL